MAAKSEKLTVKQRVHEVVRLRLDGARYPDVVQYAAAHGWGVKARMIRKYIERADLLLFLQMDRDREKLFARRDAQLERLFAKAVRDHDLGTGLAVLKELAKLHGLYPEQRLTIKQLGPPRDRPVESLSDDELDRITSAGRATGAEGVGRAAAPTFAELERLDPAALVPPGG